MPNEERLTVPADLYDEDYYTLCEGYEEFVGGGEAGHSRRLETALALADIEAGMKGCTRVAQVIENGEYDLVILDEGNIAVKYNIFSEKDLLDIFEKKPDHVEVVVTGRGATQAVMEKADLVIEMKEVKHYFHKGVKARIGIEK